MRNTVEDLPDNRHPLEIKQLFQLPTWYKYFFSWVARWWLLANEFVY